MGQLLEKNYPKKYSTNLIPDDQFAFNIDETTQFNWHRVIDLLSLPSLSGRMLIKEVMLGLGSEA